MPIKNLVVLAQARVIAGTRALPHICTLSLDREKQELIRVCFPFSNRQVMPARRWSEVNVLAYKADADKRRESYFTDHLPETVTQTISLAEKREVHKMLLGLAMPEREAIEQSRSIVVNSVSNLKMHFYALDEKNLHHKSVMHSMHRLYYPDRRILISGAHREDGKTFRRALLDWGFAEYLRKNAHDPDRYEKLKGTLTSYKNPYLISGTHHRHTKSYMSVAVLSAPFPQAA